MECGIFYVVRGGIAWRAMPHDLPPYGIVYHYVRQWRLAGLWAHLHDVLRGDVRVLEGRTRQPSAASIDSQSVKMTDRTFRTPLEPVDSILVIS